MLEANQAVPQAIDFVTSKRLVAIGVEGLVCSYGGLQAVRGVSFEVEEGSFVGIIGPNGAGKSTLVDCISGLNQNYRGRVLAWGSDVSRKPLSKIAQLGIIRSFQVARPFGKLTVLSNLMTGPRGQAGERFFTAIVGGWRRQERQFLEEAWKSLKLFGLVSVANSYGSELSGGQERLVELSRAVMCNPRVLILDEPFAGVSPANRGLLADLLRQLCVDRGITVIMVEHRLEWVERLCSRILVMAEGQVIQDGSMESIRNDARVLEAYLGYA